MQWLAAQLHSSNAIRVWLEAYRRSFTKLESYCFAFILSHKHEILRSKDVDELPADAINIIRAHREVKVMSITN